MFQPGTQLSPATRSQAGPFKPCRAFLQAGIIISGINAEVMPGQWEFQIGPVGPLEVGDQVHIARYLLHLLGEQYGIVTTFNPKPVKGDWNGEGHNPV